MENQKLNYSDCEKDLGVHIDDKLSFDKHINQMINKCNRILAITRRTFDYLDQDIFCHIYKGLVRPHLEYAAPVWSPNSVKQKESIENVQRRATKLVPGLFDMSYPDRLKKLKIPTLAYRRTRGDMIQVYKMMCDDGGYDKTLPNLLKECDTGLRGHNKKLFVQGSNKDIGKYAFHNRITKIWNSLPLHVVNAKDTKLFEKGLDHWWKDQELVYENFKADIAI